MNKFYITTAIAYASQKPHIGNTYEIVLADAIARYKRLTGYDVYFQTGTDEHGEKIELNAIKNNQNPQEYVDRVAKEVKNVWDCVNTSYDAFVRTSDTEHKQIVAKIFDKLYQQGDIYKGNYEGWYCVPCESFFTEAQLVNSKCPDCGREVAKNSEEAYFLNLKKYEHRLINYINDHPTFLYPESRKNEIINNFIKPGLQDLCVSRSSFKWGVPINFDSESVIYVWIDALSNYITFLGYDTNSDELFRKYWPADIQVIGKDIFRFHAIYWPIILMALDLPLPKQIFGHPWLLFGDDKMSKSKGNIVYADELVQEFGIDPVRYYMLHEIPFSHDGTYTRDLLIERINSDLANILGNLVNRTISMVHKYFDGKILAPISDYDVDQDLKRVVLETKTKVEEKINEVKIADAIDAIFEIFRRSNRYIDETEPWVLSKDEARHERLGTVLYNLLESIRHGAILLSPFLPDTSVEILQQINCKKVTYETLKDFNGTEVGNLVNKPIPIFMRIENK